MVSAWWGIHNRTSVPRPGALVTCSQPPAISARSRMPASPRWPGRSLRPWSRRPGRLGHGEEQPLLAGEPDLGGRRPGVLADVDEGLLGHPVRRDPLGRRQLQVGVAGDLHADPRVLEHERRGLAQGGGQVGAQAATRGRTAGGAAGRSRRAPPRAPAGGWRASRDRPRRAVGAPARGGGRPRRAPGRSRRARRRRSGRARPPGPAPAGSAATCGAPPSPAIARSASTSSLMSRCTVASATGSWVSGSRIRKLATVTGMGRPAPRSHSSDCPSQCPEDMTAGRSTSSKERRLASVRKSAYVMVLRSRSGRSPIIRVPPG